MNLHPVTYRLRDIDVSANVYTPPNYDPSGSYPTITVAHPNGGVKEQVAGRYAQRLAKLGYITITADAAIRRYYPQMKYRHDGFHSWFS